MKVEIANFAGLSHAGAPVMMRGSNIRPIKVRKKLANMIAAVIVKARLCCQSEEIHAMIQF